MTETPLTPTTPSAAPAEAPQPVAAAVFGLGRWVAVAAALLVAVSSAALVLAWSTQQRLKSLEGALVKRQQDSADQSTEARTLARQAEAVAREAAAKLALLEARVAESSMLRTQFEDLIQSLARSRDENILADLEAAIRVALQQAAITGSAEPMVLTLKQADERLARYNQPRLERVRRAVLQDLERARAAGVIDIAVLTLRLDDVIRQVDDLPLVSTPERRAAARPAAAAAAASAGAHPGAASAAAASRAGPETGSAAASWLSSLREQWSAFGGHLWQEVRALVRVTRIEHPESMLLAPEQAFFLRENLKLRLLNARLAMLSRQFDTAQSDLRDAQAAMDRYFERGSKRVQAASEMLRQVAVQARQVSLPRPDATLAAIATASAGR